MADDDATERRTRLHLAAGWAFAVAALVTFSWLTTGAYVRQMLTPLPGEADLTMRDCRAAVACAPDAAELTGQQLDYLGNIRVLTHLSAWSVPLLATISLTVATLHILRTRHERAVRFLGSAWKFQAGAAVFFLLTMATALWAGGRRWSAVPDDARMITFSRAFDSPFTDAGHLYFLAWFVTIGVIAAVPLWTLRQQLTVTQGTPHGS